MARTPSRLRDLLIQRGVPESTIADNLTIVSGTATDLQPVKDTLQMGRPASGMVDLIVSGIGGKLIMSNPLSPTLDNPTICQDVARNILTAIRELRDEAVTQSAKKAPFLIALSTTGISHVKRDLPIAMMPMYHWMLKVPHDDKAAMEQLIVDEAQRDDAERALAGYVIVRPSLLTDGDAGKGSDLKKVRVGVEDAPAVGYTISREDVGQWVFEYLVKKGRECEYAGKAVTITY